MNLPDKTKSAWSPSSNSKPTYKTKIDFPDKSIRGSAHHKTCNPLQATLKNVDSLNDINILKTMMRM